MQWTHEDLVHVVVDDVASAAVVEGVDYVVVAVFFVAVKVGGATSVAFVLSVSQSVSQG